ncbi:MAG TPA: ferredoxin [Candidatus Nanopelagicaceae bacterium]|nr:ferredoxin [Candidatus Nanopelagicaceae bacterium]
MTFRLRVDMDRCQGHGICAVLAWRSIDLDQWGFPVIGMEPVPEGAPLRRARQAVEACPARALQLEAALDPASGEQR